MSEIETRSRSVHGRLEEAVHILDEVERSLAVAHEAEVKAEREVAFVVKAGVAVVGAVLAVVSAILFLRWLFEEPEVEQNGSVDPDSPSRRAAKMA